MKTKRAQEEMTGFIVIIVIIAILIVGSMFLFLRPKPTTMLENTRVTELLNSMMLYSAEECSSSTKGNTMADIVRMCNYGEMCGGSNSCDVLNSNVNSILNASIGELSLGKDIHGWSFRAKNNETGTIIKDVKQGQTNGSMVGSSYVIPMPEIKIELKLYY